MSTRAVCRPKPERMSCGVRSSAAVVHPKGELTRGPNTKSRPRLGAPTLMAYALAGSHACGEPGLVGTAVVGLWMLPRLSMNALRCSHRWQSAT